MVKRKVSLDSGDPPRAGERARPSRTAGARTATAEVIELFFDCGVTYHEVVLPADLPDVVSSFVLVKTGGGTTVRRAAEGEEPDVEIAILEHLHELSNRWVPIPYQLSAQHAVQVFLGGGDPRRPRVLMAVDTLAEAGSSGRHLDPALDEGRPFRPLDRGESASFLDHPETRGLLQRLESAGVDRAAFKLAALIDALGPALPRIKLARVDPATSIPVSLVLDLGNSRSTAVLVERRDKGLFAIPLTMRSSASPFEVSEETFDSRITFLPAPFDKAAAPVAVGASFALPSIARMGREALDRALETPHRYLSSLSGPKRYLWDDRPTDERWHFASKIDGEFRPIFGRVLKYVPDARDAAAPTGAAGEGRRAAASPDDGLSLRSDGPSTPADPRYAPRTTMLFALVEILSQAFAQVNAPSYRAFQGKEGNARVLRHVVMTYPSAMRDEEKAVYEALARNAVLLTTHLLHIEPSRRPNWNAQTSAFEPFLFVDEALAAQMVYVYQEIAESFSGLMEDFVSVYAKDKDALRVASVDIGGGTSDVMIAEYRDKLPGTGTSLSVKKLFQDGISVAGDDVCRAILEDIVFSQILQQMPSPASRSKVIHLFGEGDAGHGAAWRTLKAKLVPYFWLPLARCYWAIAEGVEIPGHASDKLYAVGDLFAAFDAPYSAAVVAEADRFLASIAPDFPGMNNLFFRFDRAEIERAIESTLRGPLRKYADIIAQFDVDLLVLAGRTSKLPCVKELFVSEMPVVLPRLKTMASYRVGDWYPSKWRHAGLIKDPKSTVAAGATVLHLASKNRIQGFLLDDVQDIAQKPIYGLYQETEPHIARANELFRKGPVSAPFTYTNGMIIGFRNVDSEEMDGSPLFEVRPKSADVEQALLEDRVSIQFALGKDGTIAIGDVVSQKNVYQFAPDDFVLRLKTITSDRYWLDTGVFRGILRYL